MKKVFTIPAKAMGKQRARITRYGAYTPAKTKEFEELVKMRYLDQHEIDQYEYAIRINIQAIIQPPKSLSERKRKELLGKPVTKKPDWDNIGKIISDALNGIAYKDDNQIYEGRVTKRYGGVDSILVEIYYE